MTDNMPDLFRRLTEGVYVIGVAHDDRRNAFTASSVVHVSFFARYFWRSASTRNMRLI